MTNPKENEEFNEELSIDELKSVSGGLNLTPGTSVSPQNIINSPNSNSITAQGSLSDDIKDKLSELSRSSVMSQVATSMLNQKNGDLASALDSLQNNN